MLFCYEYVLFCNFESFCIQLQIIYKNADFFSIVSYRILIFVSDHAKPADVFPFQIAISDLIQLVNLSSIAFVDIFSISEIYPPLNIVSSVGRL